MEALLDLLAQFITIDIFIGFGLYSLIFVLITTFKNDIKLLDKLDESSVRFLIFSGLVYFASIIIWIAISSNIKGDYPFWWMPWLQPAIWFLITQTFWIKKIKKIKTLRIVIAFILIISFERYVIIVTSIHRDYVPANWTVENWTMLNGITPIELIVGPIIKITLFCALATLYSFSVDKLKTLSKQA